MNDTMKAEVTQVENLHYSAASSKSVEPTSEKTHPESAHDVALQLMNTSVATEFSSEEERATLRRIDMVLVPLMFFSFALQYLDKACLTGSALFGILTDLDLLVV